MMTNRRIRSLSLGAMLLLCVAHSPTAASATESHGFANPVARASENPADEDVQDDSSQPQLPPTDLAEAVTILLQGDSQAAQLDALGILTLAPSPESAATLRAFLAENGDPYVRERAVLTLLAMGSAEDIPTLVEVANGAIDAGLRRTALNAVWSMRQEFPHSNPPHTLA